jgi:hypothetical protein
MGDIVVASVATMDLPAGRRVDLRRCLPLLTLIPHGPRPRRGPGGMHTTALAPLSGM